jgi:hypothetical protein
VVDLSTFNLIYYRKSDNRKYLVKRITKLDFVMIDTVSGFVMPITQSKLRSRYYPDKKLNGINKLKRLYMDFSNKGRG